MMQALSAQVIRRAKRIMSDRCVFIVSSICDGYFHDERWPQVSVELYDVVPVPRLHEHPPLT